MSRNQCFLIAVAGFLAISCGSGTGPDDPGTLKTDAVAKEVRATIDDSAFTATSVRGAFINGALSIFGTDGRRSVMITATNLASAGTYLLYTGNPYTALATIIDGNTGQFSTGYGGGGTLILTMATPEHIKGNFRFNAYTSVGSGRGKPVASVVDGVFDITRP